jgi:hypothetical protein
MGGRSKVKQCRNTRTRLSAVKEQKKVPVHKTDIKLSSLMASQQESSAEVYRLQRQPTVCTPDKYINIKEEGDCESIDDESSCYQASQCGFSSKRKQDIALADPMWVHYPKQVQNVLKKKRIDRDRLRRSLKPPGKRNYKVLFANMKKVTEREVTKASTMFKEMKDVYYNLINAEKKMHKAFIEKGLFLDHKDFNIMEVFNSAYSEYSYDDQSNIASSAKKQNNTKIHVEEFESTSAKCKAQRLDNDAISVGDLHAQPVEAINKNQISPCFDLHSIVGTPYSQQFEKFPLSHKSQKTIEHQGYKNSHRMLFYDYPTEKRSQNKIQQNTKKDFP